jgi:hypothetical protein
MAMMATTIRSSISENPRCDVGMFFMRLGDTTYLSGNLYPGKAGIPRRISNERAAEKCKIKNAKGRRKTTFKSKVVLRLNFSFFILFRRAACRGVA